MTAKSYSSDQLLAADARAQAASVALLRAATAGRAGRMSDQRGHIAVAADAFAEALRLLNPASPEIHTIGSSA